MVRAGRDGIPARDGALPLIAEDIGSDDDIEDYFSHFPEIVPADALVQLSPELARWIRQMLMVEPAERGSAAEVATGRRWPR